MKHAFYIVTDLEEKNALFDIDWVGIRLQKFDFKNDVMSSIPTESYQFKRSRSDHSCIQFYPSENSALEIISTIRKNQHAPIHQSLKIVKIEVTVKTESKVIENHPEMNRRLEIFLQFEKESDDNYSHYRNVDLDGYKDEKIQQKFNGWLAFRDIKL